MKEPGWRFGNQFSQQDAGQGEDGADEADDAPRQEEPQDVDKRDARTHKEGPTSCQEPSVKNFYSHFLIGFCWNLVGFAK